MHPQEPSDPLSSPALIAREHIARIDRTILALVAERIRLGGEGGVGRRRLSDDSAERILAAIAAESRLDDDADA